MEEWIKRPAIEGGMIGCLCCGYTPDVLPLDTKLYSSFGGWMVYKNDDVFYMEDDNSDDETLRLSDIEIIAQKDPNNDWSADLNLPLRDATYQRHDVNKWVLVHKGNGFA